MWKKFKDGADIAAKLLLPVVLLIVGNWYTTQQAKQDKTRADFDKVTALLHSLASERPRERIEALFVLYYFLEPCQFPQVVVPALERSTRDEDPQVKQVAIGVFTAAVQECPKVQTAIQHAAQVNPDIATTVATIADTNPIIAKSIDLGKLPSRVFIYIGDEHRRQLAEQIKMQLEKGGLLVPPIKLVAVLPQVNELRFYHDSEENKAREIARELKEIVPNINVKLADRPKPLRHFELWLPT